MGVYRKRGLGFTVQVPNKLGPFEGGYMGVYRDIWGLGIRVQWYPIIRYFEFRAQAVGLTVQGKRPKP